MDRLQKQAVARLYRVLIDMMRERKMRADGLLPLGPWPVIIQGR